MGGVLPSNQGFSNVPIPSGIVYDGFVFSLNGEIMNDKWNHKNLAIVAVRMNGDSKLL